MNAKNVICGKCMLIIHRTSKNLQVVYCYNIAEKLRLTGKAKTEYRISPIISRGFLQKNAIAKRGVRLTFEMRLTFEVFVKIVDRES